jgi:hypothetical protein
LKRLLADQPHRLAQDVGVLVGHRLPDDLLKRHALSPGDRGALPSSTSWNKPMIMGAAVARTPFGPRNPGDRSRRPKPSAAAAEALKTAYRASLESGSPAITSDRVLRQAMGRDRYLASGGTVATSRFPRLQARLQPDLQDCAAFRIRKVHKGSTPTTRAVGIE